MQANRLHGNEEPDGFAGLQNKATYDRLLTSEWLMADEIPEEFERRAIMGEHLFYRRNTRNSSQSKTSVVLFDCGPSQIGNPRIIHMALLILMQRRAQLDGADFYWGILQEPSDFHSHVSKQEIYDYIKARSPFAANQNLVNQWNDNLSTLDKLSELWIIGSEPDLFNDYHPNFVQIIDNYSAETNSLRLQVNQRGKVKHAEITLPDDDICTRLLRDPFFIAQTGMTRTGATISLRSPIMFSLSGRRLIIGLDNGNIMHYPVPNSPRDSVGTAKTVKLEIDSQAVAIQFMKRRCMMIIKQDRLLKCVNIPGVGQHKTLSLDRFPDIVFNNSIKLRPLYYSYEAGFPNSVFFIDDADQLIRLNWHSYGITAEKVKTDVIEMTANGKIVDYMVINDRIQPSVYQANTRFPSLKNIELHKKATGKVFMEKNHKDIYAIELEDGSWKMVLDGDHCILNPYQNMEVIGVYYPVNFSHGYSTTTSSSLGLVAINQSRANVSVISKNTLLDSPKESSKIVHATYNAKYGLLAYLLKDKTIKVYSFLYKRFLLTIKRDENS